MFGSRLNGILRTPFQRLSKHAGKLIAATIFLAGGATGLYYVTSVDSGPVGATIATPADNSTQTTDSDGCANGFTTDVVVRTNAADGTDAVLTADGLRVAEASVSGSSVTFPDVMLGSLGKHVLVAKVAGARAVSVVTVSCADHATCKMLGPTWSPDVPGLNGQPRGYDAGAEAEAGPEWTWTNQGGDRTSSAGSPYQYRIDLLTGVGVGSKVEVYVDGSKTGEAYRPTGGTRMQIAGVPIGADDGDHSVYLKCIGTDGSIGFSTRALVATDTKPPQLTTLTPGSGDRITVDDGKLRVCASTTSADAFGLSADLGEAQSNLCVAVGTSTPECTPMSAGGASSYWTAQDAAVPDASSLCDGAINCVCPSWSPCSGGDASIDPLTGCYNCLDTGGKQCSPAGCAGCPAGTTITPGTGTAYTCVDGDGGVVSREAIPCLSDSGITWDAGCYECEVAGDAAGSGCVAVHEVQVDGGCRACEYQLADGGTSTTAWQCPMCTDTTKTPNGACVELDCPGPAPFDLRVSVYDGVRNVTTRTIQGVSCNGPTGPSVEIIDPIGGSRLEVAADIAKRVLVNNGPRRDEDLGTTGAQYTVLACTNADVGSTATLYTGKAGQTLAQAASTTVAAADAGAEVCPSYRPYEARFAGATLPESWVDGLGRLKTATRLRVDVDGGEAGVGASPVVDLWVDSTLPELALEGPVGCGATLPEAGAYPLRIRSSALPVTVTVTNANGTQTYMGLSAEPGL